MASPVRSHSFDQLRHRKVLLGLGMISRLSQIRRLETLQQSQVRVAIQPVERDQFSRRGLQVAEVPRPVILVHRRNHRLLVREHLPQAIRVHNLDVGKMTKYLVDTPLVRSRLVGQHFRRQTQHGRRNLLRIFFRRLKVLLHFAFSHGNSHFANCRIYELSNLKCDNPTIRQLFHFRLLHPLRHFHIPPQLLRHCVAKQG